MVGCVVAAVVMSSRVFLVRQLRGTLFVFRPPLPSPPLSPRLPAREPEAGHGRSPGRPPRAYAVDAQDIDIGDASEHQKAEAAFGLARAFVTEVGDQVGGRHRRGWAGTKDKGDGADGNAPGTAASPAALPSCPVSKTAAEKISLQSTCPAGPWLRSAGTLPWSLYLAVPA